MADVEKVGVRASGQQKFEGNLFIETVLAYD